jgi:hypothetical protein
MPIKMFFADEQRLCTGHVQVSVAPHAKGRHVIVCTVAGETEDQNSVVATLESGRTPQQFLKLNFNEP